MRSLLLAALLQAALPPLPQLTLEAFPPSAREALARVHRAATAAPNDPQPVGELARTLHAWEQWEAAHEVYQRLQQMEPRRFDWHYLDAVVLQRLVRQADAAVRLRDALTLAPTYLPARVRLAEALLDSGRADESEPLFEALSREPAAEPVAALGRGRIAAARGRHDEATKHLERAVALFPEFGAAYYALARSYRALGRTDDAKRALLLHQQHGAKWPAVEDEILAAVAARKDDARAQVQRGVKLAAEGHLEGAIAAHVAALAADPRLADAHANLISLYGRRGDWQNAEEHYRAALASGVNLGDVHYDYGVVLGLQERWSEAAEAYRAAVAVNPLHAQARNNLGQILEREGRVEEAAAEYRQAIESQPGLRLARFNLGRMLIALGRAEEAVSELQKLTEPRDADSPRYLFALSVAHVRAGRTEDGITWANEARRLALAFGQHELAAAIARDVARLK